MKRPYEAPEVRVVGNVRDLTLGGTNGHTLDADFPAGTDFDDLTFS